MMALPMFIWMGEILFRSKISKNLFDGLVPWMSVIPGRLIHVNIFACTFLLLSADLRQQQRQQWGKLPYQSYTGAGMIKPFPLDPWPVQAPWGF